MLLFLNFILILLSYFNSQKLKKQYIIGGGFWQFFLILHYLPYILHIQLRVKVEILGNQSNLFTYGSAYVMAISQLDKCYNLS